MVRPRVGRLDSFLFLSAMSNRFVFLVVKTQVFFSPLFPDALLGLSGLGMLARRLWRRKSAIGMDGQFCDDCRFYRAGKHKCSFYSG